MKLRQSCQVIMLPLVIYLKRMSAGSEVDALEKEVRINRGRVGVMVLEKAEPKK